MSRTVVKVVMLCGTMLWICGGQDSGHGPAFEVASVKPVEAPPPFALASGLRYSRINAREFVGSYQTVIQLIAYAYGVDVDRISGPGWVSDQYFAIAAKTPAGSTQEAVPLMVQRLLAERFRLSLHTVTKEEPVYALVPNKNGVTLKKFTGAEPGTGCSGRPGQRYCQGVTMAGLATSVGLGWRVRARRAAMGATDEVVEQGFDLPVVDRTGLTGLYEIDLQWEPPGGPHPELDDPNENAFPPRNPHPKVKSIIEALETVGLKVERAKRTFEAIVIDHVERPSEN